MAQTGDPTRAGRGGESVFANVYGEQGQYFEKEDLLKMKHTRMGIVSLVNNGNNQLGSQFFITLGEGQHTIFGQVTEGLDTLEKLNEQLCDDDHKPFRDIRIAHTMVLDDPFEDPARLVYPERSPSPTLEMVVQTNKIVLDDAVNGDEGKSAEEIAEELKRREMAEQAQILEMVGDLKDADEAPPDNVLFVCKLNPVTTDEDLEIIFSRFGKIIKCEVIRDRRSKESLQYAFIEFEDPKSCEQAYFKMDNVLIDDRRIHVDFSPSVAKNYQWNKGGKEPEVKKERQRSPVAVKRERRSPMREVKRERVSPVRERRRRDDDSPRRHDSRHRNLSVFLICWYILLWQQPSVYGHPTPTRSSRCEHPVGGFWDNGDQCVPKSVNRFFELTTFFGKVGTGLATGNAARVTKATSETNQTVLKAAESIADIVDFNTMHLIAAHDKLEEVARRREEETCDEKLIHAEKDSEKTINSLQTEIHISNKQVMQQALQIRRLRRTLRKEREPSEIGCLRECEGIKDLRRMLTKIIGK